MQPIRTTARWLRLALAMLFAVITVVQVPAMAIARAAGPAQHIVADASRAAHHSSHAAHRHHSQSTADVANDPSTCYAMCCCIALSPAGVCAPAAMYSLLGLLDLAPARVMLPSLPEPADPPPRLQV